MTADMDRKPGMLTRPEGKEVLGASAAPPNALELAALSGLDVDKLNQLAEGLFTLNSRRYGPIAGAYIVVCIAPGRQWCVGQLNADRAKPFLLFEDKVFDSAELAVAEAERIKRAAGEATPRRSI
jgi:hypothetical protein